MYCAAVMQEVGNAVELSLVAHQIKIGCKAKANPIELCLAHA